MDPAAVYSPTIIRGKYSSMGGEGPQVVTELKRFLELRSKYNAPASVGKNFGTKWLMVEKASSEV